MAQYKITLHDPKPGNYFYKEALKTLYTSYMQIEDYKKSKIYCEKMIFMLYCQ